ncbi:fibronectin type III domain-containing protein [Nocardioides oleivorans]|uniref:Fibronectin type III domain-containing protein n=1 Tax=Nocardioides oleivorans TaxID=273676 RepID=A0A4Q2RZ35_9ACTN|nr:fibronectin type III domain-containing protein [Nocardioides oleivorans]RYB93325.1 fibronectin type III domain-containing protein [Nocardioides oleivorans]
MARATALRRHRAGIASGVALTLAAAAVLAYAVTASGYKKHEAELNDGGVWVVNGEKGWAGRLNKPINQLDGVVPSQDGKTRLDVVQDGAAVVSLDLNGSRGQSIDASRLVSQDGGAAAVPAGGEIRMAGGTLASADVETGDVWAVRFDDQLGKPVMSALDRQAEPLLETGEGAALAVSQSGTVVVTSSVDGTVTTLGAGTTSFAGEKTRDLPGDAGQVAAVTTVGERIVTLDPDSGVLSVVGGATASVPAGSVLQQSGPAADSVLVAGPEGLYSVDLDSGDVTTVAATDGRPVEPVRLGACTFGAWSGGTGHLATQCGSQPATTSDLGGNATNLAFRVNRGEIVLNDANSGAVWDVQQDTPIRIDNWESFTSKKKKDDDEEDNENQNDTDRRPPQAKPDSYGVRAGRTTVLHPLDNDSAPQGRILSIVDVEQPSGGARVEISPDGQTLVLQMPEDARPATFDYFVDDGRDGLSAHAAVSVDVRADRDNEAPTVREGYEKPTFKVPSGGSLSVPVLADWRDDRDGDTLMLESARAVDGEQNGAVARTTADGRIRFSAPTAAVDGQQTVRVDYAVTDGRSAAVRKSVSFQVQAPRDQKAFAPTAEPDVVRGEVGKPIKIRPLLNDLPGSDPSTPDADLGLAGKVPQQPGARIVTDLDAGQLSFTADQVGTYFLDYDAGYGNAPPDQGTIRVDVKPRPKGEAEPIAMPDTLTVYGQAPGIVDVLANDLDPAGGLLVVQRAEADLGDQLDVAIIEGRWLRISAVQPILAPTTQTVSYTISNGTSSGVRGEVVVTQRPAPEDNTPITVADKVVVRAGASVTAPVLDNDLSPSGDRLTLLGDLGEDGTPGSLDVVAPVDVTGDVGRAYVSGRVVRYVAPAAIDERDTYTVTYVAQNLDGQRANGTLRVTVVPADDPNDPPEPPTLEGRVVSGDNVKVRVPGVGVDRNGDPVTVTGITSAPRLGRIVSYGGNFLEYQAYPRTVGTDEFTYSVADSQGAFATGTVRIVIVTPTEPQPPLAVADRLTVEPGRTATFDPLANDFIAPGDSVELKLLDAPSGARLDPKTNLVTVPAPATTDEPPVVIVYSVTNGLAESRATMTLETAEDFNNPPIIYDAFGSARDSGAVVVDVLDGAYDPDGDAGDLEVTSVAGEAEVVGGTQVRAQRGPSPQVLPFEVSDADGAVATASVYIPPTGNGLPYVLDDALIELDSGESFTGKLADYVAAPDGGDVRLASGRRSWSASPSQLTVGADSDTRFTVSAAPGLRGPGAVLVEVTSATDDAGNEDTSTTDDGATVLLSIPVQVGDDTPSLECPSTVLPISAGQAFDLDIATFCKVFTLDPRDVAELDYTAEWTTRIDGVDVDSPRGSIARVTAAESATEGGEGVLVVRAGTSNTQEIRFRLSQSPPPTLLPIRVDTLEAGQSRSFDIGAYLRAGVAEPSPQVVTVENTGNPEVTAKVDGSRLTFTASKDARGADAGFRLVVSDVGTSDPPASRRAEGRVQFKVVGVPDAPGEPRPFRLSDEIGTVKMSWAPPRDDGGAPIQHYVVKEQKTGAEQRCATNICVFRDLQGGRDYTFRVKAVNRVGESEWSDLSRTAQADTAPGRVRNIRMKDRGNGTITLAWDKPADSSKILRYYVLWSGVQQAVEVPGNVTQYTATGLDNNARYIFEVRAENKVDLSLPRQSGELQSLGTPLPPPLPTVADLESGLNQTSIRIGWQGVLPEGPGPTAYTVSYSNGVTSGAVPGCQKLIALTCTHTNVPYDGLTYTYRVVASNAPGNRSQPSEGAAIQAVGRPAQWGAFQLIATGANQEAQVSYTVPDSRGSDSRVDVLVNGVSARSFSSQTGANTTRFPVPSNDTAFSVQLRVCNEDAPAGCTLSGAQSVQTFGPLQTSHITGITPVVDNQNISWVITGTSNGRPATLTVASNDRNQSFQVPAGTWSVQTQNVNLGWRENERVTVTLADPGNGRGPVNRTVDASTGSPPDPELVIFRSGDRCSTDPDRPSDLPDCRGRGWNGEDCTDNNCSFIQFSVRGFLERYTCTIQRRGRPDIGFSVDPVDSRGGNSYYYGGGSIIGGSQVALNCGTSDYNPGQGNYQGGGTGWVNW